MSDLLQPDSKDNFDEKFLSLVARYLDQVTTPDEEAALIETLRQDKHKQQEFVEYCRHATMLKELMSEQDATTASLGCLADTTVSQVLSHDINEQSPSDSSVDLFITPGPTTPTSSQGGTPVLGFLGDCIQQSFSFFSKSSIFSVLLAIVLPGLVLAVLLVDIAHQPVPPAPVTKTPFAVAEITNSYQTVWSEGVEELLPGTKLFSGQQLHFEEGLVELSFNDGSTVLIQGPATFQIRDADNGFLTSGSLVATVPKAARGFTIDTPAAKIVDLGTEFGVSVAKDGAVEAHVFKGQVEVSAKTTQNHVAPSKQLLYAKQAVRVCMVRAENAPQINTINVNSERFTHCLPTQKPNIKTRYVHQGNVDPIAEGWRPIVFQGSKILRMNIDPSIAAPVNDGTPAWEMANFISKREFQYRKIISPEVVKQSRDKGWILHARLKVMDSGTKVLSSCHITFSDGEGHRWSFVPVRKEDGSQYVRIFGNSSLGNNRRYTIPNSQDRYVDYELRCGPGTQKAELFINGQRIATGIGYENSGKVHAVRFGTARHVSKAHFALIEWRLLDESSSPEQRRGN